jgi:dienelactone hydrolase
MGRTTLFVAALVPLLVISAAATAQIPSGSSEQSINVSGMSMDMFTYRPSRCSNPKLLVVLHGLNRNAKSYRNSARPIADRLCMLIVAPLFDRQRFPTERYQRGGMVEGGKVLPSNQWTGSLVLLVVDWVRREERAKLDYSLIGHSAGGQFLSRLAAFLPTDAKRIVIANPSTHVMPNLQVRVPYGLAGVYPDGAGQQALRRYLETPITIYLGEDDDDTEDGNLAVGKDAMAQGGTRYERGLNAFKSGRSAAASNGWKFNWRLVELPGVGHSARGMFGAAQALEALRP